MNSEQENIVDEIAAALKKDMSVRVTKNEIGFFYCPICMCTFFLSLKLHDLSTVIDAGRNLNGRLRIMKNPKFNSPCLGCTERTVEPNCHSEKCEKWIKFQKELAEYNTMIFKGRKRRNEAVDFQIQSIRNMKTKDRRRKNEHG